MITIDQNVAQEIKNAIKAAKNITIISHRNPDADTIGSNQALREMLERYGKNVTSACIDKIDPEQCLPLKINKFETILDLKNIDLIICVDISSESQLGFLKDYPDLLSGIIPVINIDHHASNSFYGNIHLVFPQAASATMVIYHLFQTLNEKITKNMATWLLYGLYFDTGSFMHSNTTAEVLKMAEELLKLGAEMQKIVKNIFHNHSLEKLKLWGEIFEKTQLTQKNVAISGIKVEDLKNHNANISDISGAIDYLSMVKGNTFAAILSEDDKGNVKGSLRTKENHLNLSEIAGLFGGGGHKKASGFTIKGRLQKETHWKIEK